MLLHELVHAVRCMWGVHDFRRFDPDPAVGWGFLNSEEFCTLLVENMYRAERHIPLRGSYLGTHRMTWRPNPRRLADPYTRLQHAWVRRWVREMPRLVHTLERIPRVVAHYNPFADARYGRYGRVPAVSRGSYRVGELVDLGPLVFPGGQ